MSVGDWLKLAANTLLLKAPAVPGAFDVLQVHALNGSMWTISYEFRCYILAAVFGFIGLYRRPWLFAVLTGLMLAANLLFAVPQLASVLQLPGPVGAVVGQPMHMVRLLSAFMTGTCFWLLKPKLGGRYAILAAVVLPAAMFVTAIQPIVLSLLGGYLLFWLAFECEWSPLRRINAKDDISYGVYLYAFPITQLLIFFWRDIPAPVLILATFLLSLVCGSISWRFVEKPALGLKRRLGGALALRSRERVTKPV
jgi:peptidoglycan/LPS O-acetylase OafA/YrhL